MSVDRFKSWLIVMGEKIDVSKEVNEIMPHISEDLVETMVKWGDGESFNDYEIIRLNDTGNNATTHFLIHVLQMSVIMRHETLPDGTRQIRDCHEHFNQLLNACHT